jgi:glucose/arabinose dehydrogenase
MRTSTPSARLLRCTALALGLGLTAACRDMPTKPVAHSARAAVMHTQAAGPSVVDPNLKVRTVIAGLTTPIGVAFLGNRDMLVLEKNTGKVQRVVNGVVRSTVLDLAVNACQERGLVSIALHPDFPKRPWVYLFWTESTTGTDVVDNPPTNTNRLLTPLLGHRVDRFIWNRSTLTYDKTLIRLRAFQQEPSPEPIRANHVGGVIRFGRDEKLYVFMGDAQRRSQLQNLPSGPTPTGQGTPIPDDQFGGPRPDNAHFTGGILRLNDDGSTPTDNPFYAYGASVGGEVGANIQKLFAYGMRNSIGMAVDPKSGNLWTEENADDAFDELNRVERGMNGGWIQIMGPVDRIAQFKAIEQTAPGGKLLVDSVLTCGHFRLAWLPDYIADSPAEALSRLFVIPGSHYKDPEFSWKYVVPPAGIGFLGSPEDDDERNHHARANDHDDGGLGPQYEGDLFVGSALAGVAEPLHNGFLFRFNLTGNRRQIAVDDPRLEDRVADNLGRLDFTESESLLFGRDFGVVTDIETGPNGNLFLVTISSGLLPPPTGAIYEIFRPDEDDDQGDNF